jgi:hypothetical protein
MSSDRALLLVLSVPGSFVLILGAGLWLAARRAKLRDALARNAPILRTRLAGPIVNRRMLAFALPMLLFSFAMGGLSKKGGPIPQSNPWVGGLVAVVMLAGAAGAGWSATRNYVGTVELDREEGRLRVRVGDEEASLDLRRDFDLLEFTVPPAGDIVSLIVAGLNARGGTVLEIRQQDCRVSYWYPEDSWTPSAPRRAALRSAAGVPRTNALGRIIHEHLRDVVASRSA